MPKNFSSGYVCDIWVGRCKRPLNCDIILNYEEK